MSRTRLKNNPVDEVQTTLKEEIKALREQVRIQTDFFDTLSHDLRTPLTAIKAYTDLLIRYREEKEEIQLQFLRVIADESDRMHALINDYLDLSKMENRRCIHLRSEKVDLVELVDYFLTVFSGALLQKRIKLLKTYVPDLPIVSGDKQRLSQVMTNLIGNAVKFTPEGGRIHAEVKCLEGREDRSGEKREWVSVTIEDSGPGIPEEAREHVFNKFYQIQPEEREKQQGTGLGLPIVKEIIELHGGEIIVEEGHLGGSAMIFFLPVFSEMDR